MNHCIFIEKPFSQLHARHDDAPIFLVSPHSQKPVLNLPLFSSSPLAPLGQPLADRTTLACAAVVIIVTAANSTNSSADRRTATAAINPHGRRWWRRRPSRLRRSFLRELPRRPHASASATWQQFFALVDALMPRRLVLILSSSAAAAECGQQLALSWPHDEDAAGVAAAASSGASHPVSALLIVSSRCSDKGRSPRPRWPTSPVPARSLSTSDSRTHGTMDAHAYTARLQLEQL